MTALYHMLRPSHKKVPLFLALNLFDTLSSKTQAKQIEQLSLLQNSGDKILILLDSNPHLEIIIAEAEARLPGYAMLPWQSNNTEHMQTELLLLAVPHRFLPESLQDPIKRSQLHCSRLAPDSSRDQMGEFYALMAALQRRENLPIVDITGLWRSMIKKNLERTGYETKIYYHTTFTTGPIPPLLQHSSVQQDLIYRAATEALSVRQWNPSDPQFIAYLQRKNVELPREYTPAFLQQLRERGEKIFASELLVVEATKK
jgi:hypothetical protein